MWAPKCLLNFYKDRNWRKENEEWRKQRFQWHRAEKEQRDWGRSGDRWLLGPQGSWRVSLQGMTGFPPTPKLLKEAKDKPPETWWMWTDETGTTVSTLIFLILFWGHVRYYTWDTLQYFGTRPCCEVVKSGQTTSPQAAIVLYGKTLPSRSFEVMTDTLFSLNCCSCLPGSACYSLLQAWTLVWRWWKVEEALRGEACRGVCRLLGAPSCRI